jgi:hypothetical protein
LSLLLVHLKKGGLKHAAVSDNHNEAA